jgi:hypothetical protein
MEVSAQPQPEPEEHDRSDRPQSGSSQPQIGSSHQPQAPGVWLPFLLFVAGFTILVAESKYTLPIAADYALKGLGGGLCLVTVVWIRREARKAGIAKRRQLK